MTFQCRSMSVDTQASNIKYKLVFHMYPQQIYYYAFSLVIVFFKPTFKTPVLNHLFSYELREQQQQPYIPTYDHKIDHLEYL